MKRCSVRPFARFLALQAALLAVLLCFTNDALADPFRLTDTSGAVHALTAYRGKWVVLNVWATWCVPCIREMPELESLSKSRGDIVVLGLAADGDNPRRLKQYAQALHATYPIIAGDAAILRPFGIRAYPTTLLFDPAGVQVLRREGPVTSQEIGAVVDAHEGRLTSSAPPR
jgi:thiol-disulfide isomerase/thioredoxin